MNNTLAKLEACIQRASLWSRLSQFQQIADENPGSQGHPNRDTGTPGYAASVAYVAKLMRRAGYAVTIQQYIYRKSDVVGVPRFSAGNRAYAPERDWYVARLSGAGTLTGTAEPPSGSQAGCSPSDFAGFTRGNVALMRSGACDFDTQVENAQMAGAGAAILYGPTPERGAYEARLVEPAKIPVAGVVSYGIGIDLLRRYRSGDAPVVHIDIRQRSRSDLDYNVIADSPYGDPHHVVVIDAHLDAIYGAGMLDNASGSTSILEIALDLAKTKTRNRLRFIWFGGEELGLLGSRYYTTHLTQVQLRDIAFDVDADVTATPNYDILIADPARATKVKRFPPNVVPDSKIGNDYFKDFFDAGGVIARSARFGNDGTDSFAFSLAGVPNSGILTQQDCCKHPWETKVWGGFLGNYEGKIPSFNGGCVDRPHRWCDNLSNNDPFVFELATKAVAYVTFKLAGRRHFPR
ncbi:MAG TPA: M28 family metallopeptidase [Candidatus Cybelea sp.]|nr:M28 family metallopeptidase [Candidatus Cybelea sp.]